MIKFLVIAGIICMLDITGFKCTEELEKILYSEENSGTEGTSDTTPETEPKKEKLTKKLKKQKTSKKKESEKEHESDSNAEGDTAKEAEDLIKDIYEQSR